VGLQFGACAVVELAVEERPQLLFELPTVQRPLPPMR
jgi:hypothetical protein